MTLLDDGAALWASLGGEDGACVPMRRELEPTDWWWDRGPDGAFFGASEPGGEKMTVGTFVLVLSGLAAAGIVWGLVQSD